MYLDKIFDSVGHSKVLLLLSQIGILGSLYNILLSYLSCRITQVRSENSLPNSVSIAGRVLQGSALGPLLFVIYINDIAECLPNGVPVRLFADDVKLYFEINCYVDVELF